MKFYYVLIILFSINFQQANCVFFVEVFAKYAKQQILHSLRNISQTQCAEDLKQFVEDLSNYKPQALKMLDAASKLQSGLFQFNTRTTGDYDECLGLSNGQYCTIHFEINGKYSDVDALAEVFGLKFKSLSKNQLNIKHHVGLCVPNSCEPQDIKGIITIILSNYIKLLGINCTSNEAKSLSATTLGAIYFFVFIVVILIISTIYELKNKENTSLLTAFSLYSNSRKLFTCKPQSDDLGAVNGIRTISVLWVILGHTTMYTNLVPTINYISLFKWKGKFSTSIPLAAAIAVDAFFTLSGMLIIYTYLSVVAQGYKVSISGYFLQRFLRLSPALYATVIFYSGLLGYFGDGPYWYTVMDVFVKNCEQNWWTTLLYIQTEWNAINECVTHSWYLAVDTQLYLISPIIFTVLRRSPRKFLFGVLLAFLTSSSAAFIITVVYRLGSASLESSHEYFLLIYWPTYIRMMPWLVGLVWGYILFKWKNRRLKLKKSIVVTAWLLSISTFIYLIIFHVLIHRHEYNVYTAALFNSLGRAVWGVCVGWVVFACAKGYGGFVNTFLSNPVFTIIARLSYSMYLMHYPIVLIEVYSRRHPSYLSNAVLYLDFLGVASVSIMVSIFWTLSFEMPIGVITKALLQKYMKHGKVHKNVTNV